MRLVIAIPPNQSGVAGVVKKELQCRRLHVAIAKDDIGFSSMPRITPGGASQIVFHAVRPPQGKTAVFNANPTSPFISRPSQFVGDDVRSL